MTAPLCPNCHLPGELVGRTKRGAATYRCTCGLAWSARGRPKSEEPRVQVETSVTAAERATLASASEASGRPVADLLRAGGLAEAERILAARAAE